MDSRKQRVRELGANGNKQREINHPGSIRNGGVAVATIRVEMVTACWAEVLLEGLPTLAASATAILHRRSISIQPKLGAYSQNPLPAAA
jgi:hypothetical protein